MTQPVIVDVSRPYCAHTSFHCCICQQSLLPRHQQWAVTVHLQTSRQANTLKNLFSFGAYHQYELLSNVQYFCWFIYYLVLPGIANSSIVIISCKNCFKPLAQLAVDLQESVALARDTPVSNYIHFARSAAARQE